MNLPFDRHKTESTAAEPAGFAFELPAPAAVPAPTGSVETVETFEAPLAAAFGVLLFRYSAQPAVAVEASRIEASGLKRRLGTMNLRTTAESRCRDVVEEASAFLRRTEAGPDDAAAAAVLEVGTAAITFVRAEAPPPLERSPLDDLGEDLRLVVCVGGERIRATLVYNASLFRLSTIERAAAHLKELLAQLLAEPDTPISRLRMLTAAERKFIEAACDGTPHPPHTELVHKAFEARAARAPDAIAARFRDRELTYGALNARANALARRLAAEGVGAESRVAVCLEPSLDVPVALLAILKAGAVYVPLDPTHPQARLRALLEDVQPRALITRPNLLEKLGPCAAAVLASDGLDALASAFPNDNLDRAVRPEHTAFIFFTSGTTGAPKGAMASTSNLASYVAAARARYAFGPGDVVPAIARFTFSISLFELMPTLTAGGTLLILDREHILDLERMSKTLEEVTIFHAGPSLLKNLVAHIKRSYPDFRPFARVRHASSGGDMIPPELLEALKEIFTGAAVFAIYGCTEISCMGCTFPVPRDRMIERTYVGRPLDGAAVRVMDPAFNTVPIGVVGEICFSGDGVVKGYLNRPDLTAQKFIELDGRRFYRTGDMGRLSEDGWLEVLGRSDFQVKLRGMRVELGEIEHYLRRAAGVRDGVVMPMTLGGSEKALVAYIVMDRDRPLDPRVSALDEIHRHLAKHLPEYMLPATYVELDNLPLNHNMKVDRNALPPPAPRRREKPAPLREPRSETEKRLAALWRGLLSVDAVGIDDRFFDVGGSSLLGLELIVAVERELGVVLKGLEIVREPLEGLAAICDARRGLAPEPGPSASAGAPASGEWEAFHFGESQDLYGLVCGAGGSPAQTAVLICPPIGQDRLRSHFILQRLADRLAAREIPSLRFDYYGCGDSMGESVDAGCARWRRDILDAYRELKRRVGAAPITAVGARLGAALLADAARELELAALVLWDPVCDGAAYWDETAATHERFVGKWRRFFRPPPAPENGAEELLGLTCGEPTVKDIRALALPPAGFPPRLALRWLATSDTSEQRRRFEALASGREGCRFETLDCDPGWNEVPRLGDLLPDLGISRALEKLAS